MLKAKRSPPIHRGEYITRKWLFRKKKQQLQVNESGNVQVNLNEDIHQQLQVGGENNVQINTSKVPSRQVQIGGKNNKQIIT